MNMEVTNMPVGPLEVNCYLVWNPESKDGLIIDPGDDPEEIVDRVRELSIKPRAALLTHAHIDHIRGLGAVVAAFGCPAWVHAADLPLYRSPANALPPWLPAAEDLPAPADQPPACPKGLEFAVIHTPGHSPGSCCFHFAAAAVLFAGDTLFAGSVGRTDLPGGDQQTLLNSIRQRLLGLPPDTRVYCGHGPETTISREIAGNPFLQPG